MKLPRYWRDSLFLCLLAMLIGIFAASRIQNPGYTDAFYYFDAGQRLAQGKGLTDAALFSYLGTNTNRLAPGLPIPSHLYWMPGASLVAAAGMTIGGPTFKAAQCFFVVLYAALVVLTFWIGVVLAPPGRPPRQRRIGWFAALLILFSGFFMPYWFTTATFAPFGVAGALSLLGIGLGRRTGNARWYLLGGIGAALAHLTRADGLLFVLVLLIVALWPRPQKPRIAWKAAFYGLVAYGVAMSPWFIRNLNAVGVPLPAGGLDTAWMRSYDEIVNYPPGASVDRFLSWGIGNILQSRWEALQANLQRFIAEQGMIILIPFLLLGLWRLRRDPALNGLILYALGMHAAMTFVFAFPGMRGGQFHSASALLPFWAALGMLGLDSIIDWIAPKRRWRAGEAKIVFGSAIVVWAVYLSLTAWAGKAAEWNALAPRYEDIDRLIPADAVVMINDPSAFYYFTGRSGVPVPNAAPDVIPTLAARFGVNYVVLDGNRTEPFGDLYAGQNVPPFLELVAVTGEFRVYKVKNEYVQAP